MIAAWMAYALVTGTLVAVICSLVEGVARARGLATRGVWVAGMVAMLLIGVAVLLPGGRGADLASSVHSTTGAEAEEVSRESSAAIESPARDGSLAATRALATRLWSAADAGISASVARLSHWDRPLLVAWALVTAFLAGVFVHAALEGRRLRHGLERRDIAGTSVLLTEGVGPSAAGFRNPAILLPRWALELDDSLLALVLRHEREHLAVRDPLLLLVALATVVLVPWHLPLWWSWHRLRLAIEIDCDRRVLRAEPVARRYAQLLLLAAQRAASPWASRAVVTVVAPLRPQVSHLTRRISAMTESNAPQSVLRTLPIVLGVVAALSLVLAIPQPRRGEAQSASTAAPARAVVRLTSVALRETDASTTILVYATGSAQVGLGTNPPVALTETLRLTTLPAITADVTEGEVHIEVSGPGTVEVGGAVTGGPALQVAAEGDHIVILKGGVGIEPRP